jgi:putative copper resistance protein D
MSPDLLSVIVRGLGFVALFQAVGAVFFLSLFARQLDHAAVPIRRLAHIAAAAGLILIVAHLALEPARLAGDYDGLWDRELQGLAWHSASAASQLLQALGLLVIVAGGAVPALAASRWATGGGLLAIAAFLLSGHTRAHPLRALLAPLLAVHLLIVAFWFGSLGALLLVSRRETRARAVEILQRFSLLASWLVPLILLAGLSMGAVLARSFSVLQRPYGELLLVKLAGFALLLLLAVMNRWRLVPAFATDGRAGPLRRSMAAEAALLVALLATTAVLTTFFSPQA